MNDTTEQRVLICAPLGKDAELAAGLLERTGISCLACKTLPELMRELDTGAGAVLSVEEALPPSAWAPLVRHIANQATWSDLPILILTRPGGDSPWIRDAYDKLGNLTLLERPVRTSTLISAVRSALRARLRQYEIRDANQRKDEFLAMLAHELRNPLAPVGAAAQLLGFVADDPDKVRQTAEVIGRQVGHLTSLIDDLLDVARVTRGLIVLAGDTLDFRRILSDAMEQVSPQIDARHHRLVLDMPPDPAMVEGDYKRLVQVVSNLLTNAAKYTPEGGDILVRLQLRAAEVVVEVSDNGIGMAPEMLAHVFDLFAQAQRTSDRSQGGLGLGLALVKNLVESHGGSVLAGSEGVGKGSTFTVRLPRLPTEPVHLPGIGTVSEKVDVPGPPLRVLVVDDNADAANVLEMLLSATGHEVRIEYTAAGALERARQFSPQVCLLDIGLPDMDGKDLAHRLRSMPETAGAMLVAATGYGQEQDRKATIAAGFDHHFVKPVDTARLLALLREYRARIDAR